MIDLGAYFSRIGYDGPRTATLATLRALHALHPASIPFEAIDVVLGRGVDISPDADALERVLAEVFGLAVAADWRPALERAAVADGV